MITPACLLHSTPGAKSDNDLKWQCVVSSRLDQSGTPPSALSKSLLDCRRFLVIFRAEKLRSSITYGANVFSDRRAHCTFSVPSHRSGASTGNHSRARHILALAPILAVASCYRVQKLGVVELRGCSTWRLQPLSRLANVGVPAPPRPRSGSIPGAALTQTHVSYSQSADDF